MLYASSATTYGKGDNGFDNDHKLVKYLKPLNEYARSKQKFDLWVLKQESHPPGWAGLKFFNVYGPNEYYKKRMSSVIFHFARQVIKGKPIKLFKSHKEEIEDGHQARDFIYVMVVIDLCYKFMESSGYANGIFNVGTGKSRTFLDLAGSVLHSMKKKVRFNLLILPVI